MLGMHGTYEANWAMNQADLIVCLGARFDDLVTGRLDAFAPNSRKIHIDIDRSSVNKTVRVDLAVIGDAGRVMEDMIKLWKARQEKRRTLTIGGGRSTNGAPSNRFRSNSRARKSCRSRPSGGCGRRPTCKSRSSRPRRSEEHTTELQ